MNDTGRPTFSKEPTMRIRSVDGTAYEIADGSAVNYILHPVFMKFLMVACAIYALLDQDTALTRMTGWLIWGLVIALILLWLVISAGVIRRLVRRGLIKQVWTPVLLLPMLVLTETSVQSMYVFFDLPPKSWDATLSGLTRDMAFVLFFDFLHGQYVVASHPNARIQTSQRFMNDSTPDLSPAAPPQVAPPQMNRPTVADAEVSRAAGNAATPSQPPELAAEAAAPSKAARLGSVRIGAETFILSDILMIRIADHYLNVITRTGTTLQRAKLAAIKELHNGDLGIQINRSVWVAFWAIREVQAAKNGQILLVLANGDDELVAKPRLHAFRQAHRIAAGETA